MNVYDTAAVQRVWARVQASQEDRLAILLAEELQTQKLYLLLAQKYPRYAPMLRQFAADELRHAKRLSTLYASVYQRRADVAVAKPKHYASLQAALQDSYEAEQNAAQRYQQAASIYPAHTALFLSLAAEEARHAERLQAFLKRQKQQAPR